jgi:hypothetical protein
VEDSIASVKSVAAHWRNRGSVELRDPGYTLGFIKYRRLNISVRSILLDLVFIALIAIYGLVVFCNFSALCQDEGLVLARCISQFFNLTVFGRDNIIVLRPTSF